MAYLEPTLGAIARSADLAYTTVPAEWRRDEGSPKPFGSGDVSVWKSKGMAGRGGAGCRERGAGPAKDDDAPPLELSFDDDAAGKTADPASARRRRSEAEQSRQGRKADSTIALGEAGSPNVRVHRDGVFPAVGRDAARLMLSVRRGSLTLGATRRGDKRGGRLGHAYGNVPSAIRDRRHGHYLQIGFRD